MLSYTDLVHGDALQGMSKSTKAAYRTLLLWVLAYPGLSPPRHSLQSMLTPSKSAHHCCVTCCLLINCCAWRLGQLSALLLPSEAVTYGTRGSLADCNTRGVVCRFLVTEGRERVGGNITSVSGNGYRWEEGPSSFQPNDAMLKAAVSLHTMLSGHGLQHNSAK